MWDQSKLFSKVAFQPGECRRNCRAMVTQGQTAAADTHRDSFPHPHLSHLSRGHLTGIPDPCSNVDQLP